MPAGRKARRDRERLPSDEAAAPLEHRPRTPSCASLNSSSSTASREIEIITGGCEKHQAVNTSAHHVPVISVCLPGAMIGPVILVRPL